jgi:hypothetical protein
MGSEIIDAKGVDQAIVRQEPQQQALAPQTLSPGQMLSIAVQQGADTQKLKELMDLQDRHEVKLARLAYSNAIVHFQAMCPVVIRTGNNTRFGNQYPQWSSAQPQIKTALVTAQLAVTHLLRQDDKGTITVIGQVRHGPSGHIEEVRLSAQPDYLASKEGKAVRNEVQAIKSTITYLQWETAACLLGLQSRDRGKEEKIDPKVQAAIDPEDDDGNKSGSPIETPKPHSQTAIADPENEAKRDFRDLCITKAERTFTRDQLLAIFSKVQSLSGKTAAADCVAWLTSDNVLLGKDGTIAVQTDGQAGATEDGGATDPTDGEPAWNEPRETLAGPYPAASSPLPAESPSSPWCCDECGTRYPVQTAGGKCLTKGCFGQVLKVKE